MSDCSTIIFSPCIISLLSVLLHSDRGLQDPRVIQWCEQLYNTGCTSPHLLAYLIDVAIESGEASGLERALQVNITPCDQVTWTVIHNISRDLRT